MTVDSSTAVPPADIDTTNTEDEPNNPIGIVALAAMFGALWYFGGITVLAVVIGLLVMIFLHELGHFMTARWTGMKATEFFLGFGPRIFSFRRGETTYGMKWIPAGAYVRIVGMNNLDPPPAGDEDRAYMNKPYWAKMWVITAGSVMHFIQALVILVVLYAVIGVGPFSPHHEWSVGELSRLETGESPAVEAGLELGDRVVAVDGVDTTEWVDLIDAVGSRPGEEVTLTVERDGSTFDTSTTLAAREGPDGVRGFLGVAQASDRQQVSVGHAFSDFGQITGEAVMAIPRFFSPASFANLGSLVFEGSEDVDIASDEAASRPISMIGVVRIAAASAQYDWTMPLSILAFINIFVGVINLIPLLPLDGGHAAVATYEKGRSMVTGRDYRVDVAKLMPLTYAVVAVLAFLGLSTMYLDIARPIG